MESPNREQNLKVSRILWFVFLGTPVLMAVALFSVMNSHSEEVVPKEMSGLFWVGGAIFFFLALFFRKQIPDISQGFKTRFPKLIICWIVNEMVAVYGISAGFIMHDVLFAISLIVVSLLLTATLYPRLE